MCRRKCSFYDLAEHHRAPTDATEIHAQPAPTALRLEVILKIIANELSEDALDAIRRGVNVGDIVRIHGFVERSGDDESATILLHARNITSVRAWKDVHPGTSTSVKGWSRQCYCMSSWTYDSPHTCLLRPSRRAVHTSADGA